MSSEILNFDVLIDQSDGTFIYQSDEVQSLQVKTISGTMLHKSRIQIIITLDDGAALSKIPVEMEEYLEDDDGDEEEEEDE